MRKSKLFYVLAVYFILIVAWWLKLHKIGDLTSPEAFWFNIFYGFVGLIGGINGLIIARRWGGLKSLIGKALFLLSIGLLSEWVANIIWGYYNVVKKLEVPYPSEADIFFFAIIPIYALSMYYLSLASSAAISLKSIKNRLVTVIVPLVMLTIAYILFVGQGLDFSDPTRLFFDLGYPLGESITFSIALLTFYLTKDYLGGVMKRAVLGVIAAYLVQFIADYGFLYTALNETYFNANWVDLLYAVAMLSMSLAIINFDVTLSVSKGRLGKLEKDVTKSSVDVKNIETYKRIIKQMIMDQEKIVGPLALMQANDVSDLSISEDYSEIVVARNPDEIFTDLVKRYESLFGLASVEMLRASANKVIEEENLQSSLSLKF